MRGFKSNFKKKHSPAYNTLNNIMEKFVRPVQSKSVQKVDVLGQQEQKIILKEFYKLNPVDPERRKKLASWFLSVSGIENFFFVSGESYFHLNEAVNNHNL